MNHIYRAFSKKAKLVVSIPSVCTMMAVLCIASASLQAQGLVDLGVLPGGTASGASAINNDGVVVGCANVVGTGWDAVKWQNGQISSIYSSALGENFALDVNSLGDVAGTASVGVPNIDAYRGAARWIGGNFEFLPADPCGYLSDAYGINDSGWVVGHFLDTAVSAWADRAFLWKGSTVTKLPPLISTGRSYAKKINNKGIIVGYSTPDGGFSDDRWYGCVWFNGQIYPLPPASGYYQSFAFDINDSNTIVGISSQARDYWEGIVTTWKVTIINGTDLQVSAPIAAPLDYKFEIWYELAGSPVAINNMDIVVGVGTDTLDDIDRLFMYRDGAFGDLSDFVNNITSTWYCTNATTDINDSGQIVGTMDVGSPSVGHGFLLTGKYLGVNMPSENALMVAGESNIISWTHLNVSTINIYYQIGESPVQYLIADHYSADSHYFVWDVPDTLLSAKVKIRIEDVSSSTYAESKTFRIKGYVLTRLNDDGDYEAFRPNLDGWQMPNDSTPMWPAAWYNQFDYVFGKDPNTNRQYSGFGRASKCNFVDWPLFVETFGLSQSYFTGVGGILLYRQSAVDLWFETKDRSFGGSCFGFSQSTLLAFDRKEAFLSAFGLPDFSVLYNVPVSDSNRKVINRLYESQLGKGALEHRKTYASKSPNDVLAELKATLLSDTNDHSAMGIYSYGPSPGGHSVVPYRVIKDPGNPAMYRVYTYDSNNPGDTGVYLEIDTVVHRWTFAELGWSEDTAGSWILRPPASHFLEQPQMTSAAKAGFPPAAEADAGSNYMQVFFSDARDIWISGQGGSFRLDTINGISISGDSALCPIIPETGGTHRPIGLYLPAGYCTMNMSQLRDSDVYVSFRTDSLIWNYSRQGADSTQSEALASSTDFVKTWCNDQTKAMALGAIIPGDSAERTLEVDLYTVEPGNSPELRLLPDGDFALESYSSPTYCMLRLGQTSTKGLTAFQYDSLYLEAETRYIIHQPHWDSLETEPLKILIDHWYFGYGTVDDSVTLNNQPVDVDESGDLGLPRTFQLSQNYPNPFNPATTIEYSLPKRSDVVIDIYDILGRKVRQLVNETRSAGVYKVTWDGTDQNGNPVSTGIYLYRIQAGDFMESRKMLLIK